MPRDSIPVFCIGLSHQTTPVELLEKVALAPDKLTEALEHFAGAAEGSARPAELVIISTCNRFEMFGSLADNTLQAAEDFLRDRVALPASALKPFLHRLTGREAARRLYRIASGLESMVIGESQIIGQVASAYAAAQAKRRAGPFMTALFQGAIRAGRRARRETGIGRSARSISAAAVGLAREAVGDLAQARLLVLGAGEMGRLALRSLREHGAGEIDVASRQFVTASRAARRWGAKAHLINTVPCLLEHADVVVSSTSAAQPIITAEMLRSAMRERAGRSLTLIDIAMPRNIAPEAACVPGVRLFDLDSLKGRDAGGERVRALEIPRVESIIEEELDALSISMAEEALRPLIGSMWLKAHAIREEVLERMRSRVPQLDDASWAHIERLSLTLINKLLHAPATRLRAEAGNGHAREYAQALRYLFDLPEGERLPEDERLPEGERQENRRA